MCTITIRKFVLCLFLFVMCITFNAVLHKSVLNISLLRKSPRHETIPTIVTADTSVTGHPWETGGTRHSVQKPLQVMENGEFVRDENKNIFQNREEHSSTESLRAANDAGNVPSENGNFSENYNDYSSFPANFSTKTSDRPDPIVNNAVWPFCIFGGSSGKRNEEPPRQEENPDFAAMPTEVRVWPNPESGTFESTSSAKTVSADEKTENGDRTAEEMQPGSQLAENGETPPAVLPEGFHVAPMGPPSRSGTKVTRNKPAAIQDVPMRAPEMEDSQVQPVIYVEPKPKMQPFPEVVEENFISETELSGSLEDTGASRENGESAVSEEENLPDVPPRLETGNFPLSLDAPLEEAPASGHFGLRHAVVMPDIPRKNESGADTAMILEGISELKPKERLREFPPVK